MRSDPSQSESPALPAPASLAPELAGARLELLHPGRNRTKGRVWLARSGHRTLVVKEITSCPVWMKWLFARRLLAREVRTYRALAGVRGIPELVATPDPDVIVISHIDGTPLHELPRERLSEALFDRLASLLRAIHARGVACGDLHHRNVIVTPDGETHMVDFALATVSGPRWRLVHHWVTRRLAELDDAAFVRMRIRYLRRLPTSAEQEILRRGARLWRTGRSLKRALSFRRAGREKENEAPVEDVS